MQTLQDSLPVTALESLVMLVLRLKANERKVGPKPEKAIPVDKCVKAKTFRYFIFTFLW